MPKISAAVARSASAHQLPVHRSSMASFPFVTKASDLLMMGPAWARLRRADAERSVTGPYAKPAHPHDFPRAVLQHHLDCPHEPVGVLHRPHLGRLERPMVP